MEIDEFYFKVRNEFPNLIESADSEFMRQYGEVDYESKFLWFESLANCINRDMRDRVKPEKYKKLFEFFRKSYLFEGEPVKKCIDVSFVENLFWNVSAEHAKEYWEAFPEILKELYISFHIRKPA